jgi:choline-glycine betaine transporter
MGGVSMETNIEKGRNMVIIAICIMLGVSLLNFLLNQISGVNENFFVWVVRFLLTCLLCYFNITDIVGQNG